MKNIWKGLIDLGIGYALFVIGSGLNGSVEGFTEKPYSFAKIIMCVGIVVVIFGPIFFWIILPLKNRWYKIHPTKMNLGDSVVVNDIRITPTLATYTDTTTVSSRSKSEEVKAKDGHVLLVIKFKGRHIGNYQSSACVDIAKLLTTKGYFYDSAHLISFNLQPEEEKSDYLVFEIPQDQKGVEVYFKVGLKGRKLQLKSAI